MCKSLHAFPHDSFLGFEPIRLGAKAMVPTTELRQRIETRPDLQKSGLPIWALFITGGASMWHAMGPGPNTDHCSAF